MRGRVFISYRRDDAPGDARSIHDRLARKFGATSVFMDVDTLSAGQRFDIELDKALADCEVLVAIIGRRWMELLADHRRLGKRDYVRSEIGGALKREIPVIPVLVGREGNLPPLPHPEDLPKDLRGLVFHQKHAVAHESFGRDAGELVAAIALILRERRQPLPWRGLALGGLAGLAAALVLAVLLGFLWSRSPSDPSSAIAAKRASQEIDAIASKGRASSPTLPTVSDSIQSLKDGEDSKRVETWRTFAATGDIDSMEKLGASYETGKGVPRDPKQAIMWYQRAADAGSELAKARLKELRASR